MFRGNSRHDRYACQLRMERLEDRQMLAAVTVSAISDVVDWDQIGGIPELIGSPGADNKISLREAVIAANQTFDGTTDTITFSTNPTHGLNGGTILLTQGELSISEAVTIDSRNSSGVPLGITIDAHDATPNTHGDGIRIFNIAAFSSAPVTLIGLTLTGGDVSGNGGAIRSAADLIVRDCTIESNEASGRGGGIFVDAAVDVSILQGSVITGNSASGSGGGLYARVYGDSAILIQDSMVSDNDSAVNGGGLVTRLDGSSSLAFEQSVISGNTATYDGGGVYAKAETDYYNPIPARQAITISRSLISGNTAGSRGGGAYLFNYDGTEVSDNRFRLAA